MAVQDNIIFHASFRRGEKVYSFSPRLHTILYVYKRWCVLKALLYSHKIKFVDTDTTETNDKSAFSFLY